MLVYQVGTLASVGSDVEKVFIVLNLEVLPVTMTQGALLEGDDLSPEGVAANFAKISDRTGEIVPQSGGEQSMQAMKLLQAKAG